MQLTAENLAQPISEDLPCGEDLEYDPAFQQMELDMQSTEEQEYGDTIDRKSTRLNSSHSQQSRMPSSA